MKLKTIAVVSLTVLCAIAIIGCGDSKQENTTTTVAPSPSEEKAPAAPKGATLGSETSNEHFTITLTAEPKELKVGRATFLAKVLHHGQPTSGAAVKISLSMPSMNMGGPELTLKHSGNGVYKGEADLSMGGDWQAKVSVEQEGHPGEAIYIFVVMQ